uniref:Uncharacterized protein n=1 Tax=Oryzias melastigma TaxID=30732 RepID=A0A3B3DNF1_ORYME
MVLNVHGICRQVPAKASKLPGASIRSSAGLGQRAGPENTVIHAMFFCFFFAGPLVSDRDPVTVKKESSRPCVLPSLKGPEIMLLHLNCFSLHMNWIRPSSSGSLHFSSTEEQSTTSGFRNRPLASLYSQSSGDGASKRAEISSMQPCCRIKSTALLGPIPLMVPQ